MILVAGGTGRLGRIVVTRLQAAEPHVRILTRDPAKAAGLASGRAEVIEGDVRYRASLRPAFAGVTTVISAIQGFDDPRSSPEATDADGNRNLIEAAREAGAQHFVLVSVVGAAPNHRMSLFRAKYAAEQALKGSGLAWTIIRATAFMEFWASLLGDPLIEKGRTQVFGRGKNPINFVSANDVADAVAAAVKDPQLRGVVLEVGGPQDLTLDQVVAEFQRASGKQGKVSHVPLGMMRVMAVLMRPIKPALARQIQAGVVMDTQDMRWNGAASRQRHPWLRQTPLREVLQSRFGSRSRSAAGAALQTGEAGD